MEEYRPKDNKFGMIPLQEAVDTVSYTDWLIKDIVEKKALCMLFGESGSYKTFMALDMLMCISQGIPFHGKEVRQAPAAIIIGEGQNSFGQRAKALAKSYGIKKIKNFYISVIPAQFTEEESAKQVKDIVSKLPQRPGIVCIDTLARNFGPGDENSSGAMNQFIQNIDLMGNDITRMLIHHSGHNNKDRARGSSTLYAAMDATYMLDNKDNMITLSCTKMKDAAKFDPMYFIPEVVPVPDLEGETSIIIKSMMPIATKKKANKELVLEWIQSGNCTIEQTKKRYADFGYKNYNSLRRAINRMIESEEIIKENNMLISKK